MLSLRFRAKLEEVWGQRGGARGNMCKTRFGRFGQFANFRIIIIGIVELQESRMSMVRSC